MIIRNAFFAYRASHRVLMCRYIRVRARHFAATAYMIMRVHIPRMCCSKSNPKRKLISCAPITHTHTRTVISVDVYHNALRVCVHMEWNQICKRFGGTLFAGRDHFRTIYVLHACIHTCVYDGLFGIRASPQTNHERDGLCLYSLGEGRI